MWARGLKRVAFAVAFAATTVTGSGYDGITGYRPAPEPLPVVIVDDNPGDAKYYGNDGFMRKFGEVSTYLQPMRQYLVIPSTMTEYKNNTTRVYTTSCNTFMCDRALTRSEKVVSTAVEKDGYFLMFLFALKLDTRRQLVKPEGGILNTTVKGEDLFVRLKSKTDFNGSGYTPISDEFVFGGYNSKVYGDAWKSYLTSVGFKYESFVFVLDQDGVAKPGVVVKVGSGNNQKICYAMYGTWQDGKVAGKYKSSLGGTFKKGDKVFFSEWMLLPELVNGIVVDSFQRMMALQDNNGMIVPEYKYGRYCFTTDEARKNQELLAWRTEQYWDGKKNRYFIDTVNFIYDNLSYFSGDIHNFVISHPNRNSVTRLQLLGLFNGEDAKSTDAIAVPYVVVPSPDDAENNGNGGMGKDYPDMYWYYDLFKIGFMKDMEAEKDEPLRDAAAFMDIESYFKDQVIGSEYDKTIYNQPYNYANLSRYVEDPNYLSGFKADATLTTEHPPAKQRIYDQSNPSKLLNGKMMMADPLSDNMSYNVKGHAASKPLVVLDPQTNEKVAEDSLQVWKCSNGREYCLMCMNYKKYGEHKVHDVGGHKMLHGIEVVVKTYYKTTAGRGGGSVTHTNYTKAFVNGWAFEDTVSRDFDVGVHKDSVMYTKSKGKDSVIDTVLGSSLKSLNYEKNIEVDTVVDKDVTVSGVKNYVNWLYNRAGYEKWGWWSYFPMGLGRTGEDHWFDINCPYDPPYWKRDRFEKGDVTRQTEIILNDLKNKYANFVKDFTADTTKSFETNIARLQNAGFTFVGTGNNKDGSTDYYDSSWYFGNKDDYFLPFDNEIDFIVHNDYYKDDDNFLKLYMKADVSNVLPPLIDLVFKDDYVLTNQKMYLTFRWPLVYMDAIGYVWTIGYAQYESDVCVFDMNNIGQVNGDDFWLWDSPMLGPSKDNTFWGELYDMSNLSAIFGQSEEGVGRWGPYTEGGQLIYRLSGENFLEKNIDSLNRLPKWRDPRYVMMGTIAMVPCRNYVSIGGMGTCAKWDNDNTSLYSYGDAVVKYSGAETNDYLTMLPLRSRNNTSVRWQVGIGYPLRDFMTDAFPPEDRNNPNSWPSEIQKKMMYEIGLLILVGEGVDWGMKGLHWLATDGVAKYPVLAGIAAGAYKIGNTVENNWVVKETCKWAKKGWKVYKEFQETLDLINAVDESWQKIGMLWEGFTEATVDLWNYYKDTDFSDLSIKNISKVLPFKAMYKFDREFNSFHDAVIDLARAINDLAVHADSAYISDAVVYSKRLYEAVLYSNDVEVEFERRRYMNQKRMADSIAYKDKKVAAQKYAAIITNFLLTSSQEVKFKTMTNGLKTVEDIAKTVEREAKDWEAFGQFTGQVFSRETGEAFEQMFSSDGTPLTMSPLISQFSGAPAIFKENLDARALLKDGDFWRSPAAWDFASVDEGVRAKRIRNKAVRDSLRNVRDSLMKVYQTQPSM